MSANGSGTGTPPTNGLPLNALNGAGAVEEGANGAAVRRPTPWAAAKAPSVQRVTARVRAKVGQLPDWDPLPPGEIQVRRPGSL
jgi:hypothetical protein